MPQAPDSALPRWLIAARSRSETYALMGLAILLLDLATGPFLLFPILFVIPVALAAWYHSATLGYLLAVLLPVGRLFIAALLDVPSPLPYIVANAGVRIAVLGLIAYLVSRIARQTRELEERVENLLKVCAWTRTVEYQGEWISFEDYLERRFGIKTTHGMSPAETQRQLEELVRLSEAGKGADSKG